MEDALTASPSIIHDDQLDVCHKNPKKVITPQCITAGVLTAPALDGGPTVTAEDGSKHLRRLLIVFDQLLITAIGIFWQL
jgi:hypothetical protein